MLYNCIIFLLGIFLLVVCDINDTNIYEEWEGKWQLVSAIENEKTVILPPEVLLVGQEIKNSSEQFITLDLTLEEGKYPDLVEALKLPKKLFQGDLDSIRRYSFDVFYRSKQEDFRVKNWRRIDKALRRLATDEQLEFENQFVDLLKSSDSISYDDDNDMLKFTNSKSTFLLEFVRAQNQDSAALRETFEKLIREEQRQTVKPEVPYEILPKTDDKGENRWVIKPLDKTQ